MGGGAEAGGTVEAERNFLGLGFADGAVAAGVVGWLVGVDGVDAEEDGFLAARGFRKAEVISQTTPELEKEWIHAGVGEVGDADACGVSAAAGTAAGDGVDAAAVALGGEE